VLSRDLAIGARAGGGSQPAFDDMSLEDVEELLIRKALARYDGNVSLAAQALGLSRSALYRRLQRHSI
jgi:transcriptional regulator of acetoin/glycerol metabolism